MKYGLTSLALIGSLAFFSSIARAAEPGDDSGGSTDKEAASSDDKGGGDSEGGEAKSGADGEKGSKDAKSSDAKSGEAGAAPSYGHKKQFGIRAALVLPYRMILRYDASPYCHAYDPIKGPNDQPKFCGFGGPLAVDVAISGALIDTFEPFLWARFGLAAEEETNTAPLMIFGIGGRIYTMADSAFKIFVEPAIGVEVEGMNATTSNSAVNSKLWRTDLVLHFAAGPHFDLHKNFGLYADAGLTVGVLRALSSSLEAKFGVQGRLP